jgi:hypothetical protein
MPDPRGCQLNRKRQAVEASADIGRDLDGRCGALEAWLHRRGAFEEELHRRRQSRVVRIDPHREWLQRDLTLAAQAK